MQNIIKTEDINSIIGANYDCLDEAKEHTKAKIRLVSDYIINWSYVFLNNNRCKKLNFVDCMANAGVYKNGVLGTSVEVLNIFISLSEKAREKDIQLNLYINDIDKNRILVFKSIIEQYKDQIPSNVKIYIESMDVNDYMNYLINKREFETKDQGTFMFVDPYNFGDVDLEVLRKFGAKFYCEILFNYFISDFRRNINNPQARIKTENMLKRIDCLDVDFDNDISAEGLDLKIREFLKRGNIKYCFSYPFKIWNNADLYHLIYATPNIKGLDKIKESIWKVFSGDMYYKANYLNGQMSLFDDKLFVDINLNSYSRHVRKLLLEQFEGKIISYKEIENYVLENSMLKSSQIIANVLKPLIANNKIQKQNLQNKRNFKEDSYYFYGG